jgi:hypothetical protein
MKHSIISSILLGCILAVPFFGCKPEPKVEQATKYKLSVSPTEYAFKVEGGEFQLVVNASKTVATYTDGVMTNKAIEKAPYKITVQGTGFSANGDKIVAEPNAGSARNGVVIVEVEGSDKRAEIVLTQEGKVLSAGSIDSFAFQGIADAVVSMNGKQINVIVPSKTDVTRLIPEIGLSAGTVFEEYTAGTALDFTNPVEIKVKGENGEIVIYTVTVTKKQAENLGFSKVVEKFTLSQETMPNAADKVADGLVSVAIVNNNEVLSVLTKTDVLYYDALTAEYKGHRGGTQTLTRWASDDMGNVVAGRSAAAGAVTPYYKITIPGNEQNFVVSGFTVNQTNNSDGTVSSGGQIVVSGDINKDAVLFYPVQRFGKNPMAYRLSVVNGNNTNLIPELVEYIYVNPFREGLKPFGNVGIACPVGPKVADGYIMGDRNELSYFKGTDRRVFKYEDVGTFNYGGHFAAKVFRMNQKTYVAIARFMVGQGAVVRILDITNPAAITMTEEERTAAGIKFVAYESEIFAPLYGNNEALQGGLDVKKLDNGNVILYLMCSSCGVKAFELVK